MWKKIKQKLTVYKVHVAHVSFGSHFLLPSGRGVSKIGIRLSHVTETSQVELTISQLEVSKKKKRHSLININIHVNSFLFLITEVFITWKKSMRL